MIESSVMVDVLIREREASCGPSLFVAPRTEAPIRRATAGTRSASGSAFP